MRHFDQRIDRRANDKDADAAKSPGKQTLVEASGDYSHAAPAVDAAASSSGEPLPADLQRKFEGSLGADLSDIRIHRSAESQAAASAVGAKAYAHGRHIHFGTGQYMPSTPEGEHLLAHEVAHTVQQQGGIKRMQLKSLAVSQPTDSHEVEADRAADAMVAGTPATVSAATPSIARKANPASDFSGKNAAAIDVAGQTAGLAATGADGMLTPVTLSTDWATQRAQLMRDRAAELANTEFVGDTGKSGTSSAGYQILISESAQYSTDVVRLSTAETAYNQLVDPANLATVAVKQLRGAVTAAGFHDELTPEQPGAPAAAGKYIGQIQDDMTPAQKAQLANMVGNAKDVSQTQATITSSEGKSETTALRAIDKEIGDAQQSMTVAKERVLTATKDTQTVLADKLASAQKALESAAADEKQKVLDEIAAIANGAKQFASVLQIASGVMWPQIACNPLEGTAGYVTGTEKDSATDLKTTGLTKLKEDGIDQLKHLYGDAPALVADIATDLATSHFEEQLNKLQTQIDASKSTIDALKQFGVDISNQVKLETLSTNAKDLSASTKRWADLVAKRRQFLATKAKEADKKAGPGKDGKSDTLSGVAVLLSDAKDAKSTVDTARGTAQSVHSTVKNQYDGLVAHRQQQIPAIVSAPDGGDKKGTEMVDQKLGPDQTLLGKVVETADGWDKLAETEGTFAEKVIASISAKK